MIFRGKRGNGKWSGLYPTLDSYGADVAVGWRRGALLAARDGPCACSKQVWDVTLLTLTLTPILTLTLTPTLTLTLTLTRCGT